MPFGCRLLKLAQTQAANGSQQWVLARLRVLTGVIISKLTVSFPETQRCASAAPTGELAVDYNLNHRRTLSNVMLSRPLDLSKAISVL